jgi:hypothetical protein
VIFTAGNAETSGIADIAVIAVIAGSWERSRNVILPPNEVRQGESVEKVVSLGGSFRRERKQNATYRSALSTGY